MPPPKKVKPKPKPPQQAKPKADDGPWDWASNTEVQNIGPPELRNVYRTTGFTVCKPQCRRNCKKNPKCLWGLGEKKWLEQEKDGEDEEAAEEGTSEDTRNEGQMIGIQNLGATCYVNSLLQLWFHNPILRRAILEWKPPISEISDPENYVPTCPIGHLQAMFARLKLSKQSSIDPSPFVLALELNAGEQQDAQEFSKLLMTLIDELLARYQHQSVRTVIKDSFTGECVYETECSVCKKKTVQNSVFNELELTVKKQLQDSILQYLQMEMLDGSNKYRCSTCQTDQVARRSTKLKKLPPILNLQLMRFVYDIETKRKKKVTTIMRFPEELDMTEHISPEFRSDDERLVYKLTAVLIHNGINATSGHYIAHIKDIRSGAWYNCNDESVVKKPRFSLVTDSGNSELANGTNGGPKKQAPTPKIRFHSSPGAYMLVYTRLEVHDEPPADPEIYDYLEHLVKREDAVFEAELVKTKAEQEVEDKKREGKKNEIEKLYEWYKAQTQTTQPKLMQKTDDGQSSSTSATSILDDSMDGLEFVPLSWLSDWLSDKQPDIYEEIDTSDLRCKHGKLDPPLPNESVIPYRLVPTTFVDSLYEKYGGQRLNRLQGEQVFCQQCVEEQYIRMQSLTNMKSIGLKQKNVLSNLFLNKGRPHLHNQTGQFFVVPTQFVENWRMFVKNPEVLSNWQEISVQNQDLLCIHGRYKYPIDLIKELQTSKRNNESIVTLLKLDEWKYIKEQFGEEIQISLMCFDDSDDIIYEPELCEDCSVEWFQAQCETVSYIGADIYIEKVDKIEIDTGSVPSEFGSDPNIPCKKEKMDHILVQPREQGIGVRTRQKGRRKKFSVSSSTKLKELQVMLMNEYKAMPSDQHLVYDGKEFTPDDRESTLGELRIKPDSILFLKIDDSQMEEPTEENPFQEVEERGFSGSVLQGSRIRQQEMV